ncbi:MAG TPA: T9SS type A sorting domain-containing protein [Ignavibacteria bacterium]
MRIFTTSILLLFNICLSIQTQTFQFYRTSPEVIYTNDTFGVISHAKLNNLTGSNNQLRIIRTAVNVPSGWESCICDIVQCHPPGLDTAIANYPPGLSNIDVILYAHSAPGTGYVTLRAEKVSNPSENIVVVFGGAYNPLGITQISTIAEDFSLSQNYPNPFNPVTHFGFSISKPGFTQLIIYDALGREVETIISGNLNTGKYEADFDAKELSSGMYYYSLKSGDYFSVRKMVLIK